MTIWWLAQAGRPEGRRYGAEERPVTVGGPYTTVLAGWKPGLPLVRDRNGSWGDVEAVDREDGLASPEIGDRK